MHSSQNKKHVIQHTCKNIRTNHSSLLPIEHGIGIRVREPFIK